MSTTGSKPRPAKAAGAKANGSVFGGGFDSATPPVAPAPAAATTPTAAAAQPVTAPTATPEPDPAPTQTAPTVQPAGPTRDLASYLGGASDGGGAGFVRAMLAGRVDPMLDLVPLGARVPRHYKEALRLLAFAQRRREQDLVQEALAALIGPQLLAEALAAQQSNR